MRALNEWLQAAPSAEAIASPVGVLVNLNDFANWPARAMTPADVLETGKYRFRFSNLWRRCSPEHWR